MGADVGFTTDVYDLRLHGDGGAEWLSDGFIHKAHKVNVSFPTAVVVRCRCGAVIEQPVSFVCRQFLCVTLSAQYSFISDTTHRRDILLALWFSYRTFWNEQDSGVDLDPFSGCTRVLVWNINHAGSFVCRYSAETCLSSGEQ